MSNPESFIDEVSEELRRDRAMQYLRKYGWIAVLLVLLLVGGTAWNEWRKASAQASAEAFGESVLAALENDDSAARIAALSQIDATGAQHGLLQLLRAGELLETDRSAAIDAFQAAAQDESLPDAYRQLAALERVNGQDAKRHPEPLVRRQSVIRLGLDTTRVNPPPRLALDKARLRAGARRRARPRAAIEILQDLLLTNLIVSEALRPGASRNF